MLITVRIKVNPTAEQAASLLATMERFNAACDAISETAWLNRTFSKYTLQKIVYEDIRRDFGLSAQMAIRAIAKVSESYMTDRAVQHTFEPHGAYVCDQRMLSFKGSDRVSILTLDGRVVAPIIVPDYREIDREKIKGQMDLIHVNGKFFLMATVDVPEEPQIEPEGVIGVDLGIVNVATTSDGDTFSGEQCTTVRKKFAAIKAVLQKAATWDAKKHLKRLAGRERRFKRDTNHTVSKQIIAIAKGTRRGIALEDLKGIRARITATKAQRTMMGKWAFFELMNFLRYKAHEAGIPFYSVNGAYTSQRCTVCGYTDEANREVQSEFLCLRCGHHENADIHAAKNIAARADVNQPIALCQPAKAGRRLKCKPTKEVMSVMPTTSVVGS